MNKSVLRTMIVIIICMLAFEYILKFFVPKEFVLVISNPNLIKFGEFLDSHKLVSYIFGCITSFITYFLYTCACSRKKYLNWKFYILFLLIYIISEILIVVSYELCTPFIICSMIGLAYLSNSNMKDFTIVFIVHNLSQVLSLNIRNITTYLISFDMATLTIMTLECYLWLTLFYFLNCFNIKEREVK